MLAATRQARWRRTCLGWSRWVERSRHTHPATTKLPATRLAVPVVVGRLTRPELFTKAYGRVFTGWGVGGLLAPWLAGRLYDRTGGYAASLLFAAGSAVVASIVALAVPRNGD